MLQVGLGLQLHFEHPQDSSRVLWGHLSSWVSCVSCSGVHFGNAGSSKSASGYVVFGELSCQVVGFRQTLCCSRSQKDKKAGFLLVSFLCTAVGMLAYCLISIICRYKSAHFKLLHVNMLQLASGTCSAQVKRSLTLSVSREHYVLGMFCFKRTCSNLCCVKRNMFHLNHVPLGTWSKLFCLDKTLSNLFCSMWTCSI